MNEKKTVNIIGSGLGGLFSGAILAKHGFIVKVFEANPIIGGYASSWKRKDYKFDSSLHEINGFFPDDKKLRAFRLLELFDKIKLIDIPSPYTSIFDNYEFTVPHNYHEFVEKLIKEFPEEKKQIQEVMDTIKALAISAMRFLNEKDKKTGMKNALFKYPNLIRFFFSTINTYIFRKIKKPELRTIIAQMLNYYSHDSKMMNLIFFSAPNYSYLNQSFWISGTSSSLSNALREIIEENNGSIYTNCKVTKINFLNKKAVSISLENNKTFPSDITVCNSPLNYTVEHLIDKKNIPLRLKNKAVKTVASTSIFSVYIGLNIDAKKLGITEFSYMLNEISDIRKIIKNQELLPHSLRPIYFTSFNLDNSLCPKGKTVVNISMVDNINYWNKYKEDKEGYKKEKQRIADILINRVNKRFKEFKNNIEVMEIGTPLTMERYTNNPEGAVYGACQRFFQTNILRFPNEIKNKNLYFASAWVSPGGGFSGAIISAIKATELILKNNNIYNRMNDYIEPKPHYGDNTDIF